MPQLIMKSKYGTGGAKELRNTALKKLSLWLKNTFSSEEFQIFGNVSKCFVSC